MALFFVLETIFNNCVNKPAQVVRHRMVDIIDAIDGLDKLKEYGMGDDAEEFLGRAVFSCATDRDDVFTILDKLKEYGMGDNAEEFLDRAVFSRVEDADDLVACPGGDTKNYCVSHLALVLLPP